MRNLKKVLSLALALVMLLGMMVIGAGAATEFTDADQITNIDAAQIAEKLGIIEGSGGQFMPTTELTRAQAAQIIARMMLGKATADTLVSTKSDFDDLDGLWKGAAEAIAYCAGQHIVEGNGAGKFFPTNKVTGLQFAKMLLVALGNDAKLEGYEGAGWATNVAVDALNAGLNVGGVPLSNAVLTRDQAVQMVFNTLTANVVEYTSRGEGWGVRATMTNTRSDYRTLNAGVTGTAGAPVGNVSDGLMQFCELHFPNLKSVTTVDSYGHPAQVWVYGVKDEITNYAPAEPAYTYTSQESVVSMGLTGYSLPAGGALYFKNGQQLANLTTVAQVAAQTGNGTKVEIYLSERYAGQIERVVVTETYLMQVDRISTVTNQVFLNRITPTMGYSVNAVSSTSPLYAALSAKKTGDYVLVTALTRDGVTYNVTEVKDPTPVQGALLGVSKLGAMTYALNMTSSTSPYWLAAITNHDAFDSLNASSVTSQKVATLYLDTYGYATHIVDFVNTASTVFVTQVYQSVINGRVVNIAHGVATDGSTIDLNLGTTDQSVTAGKVYNYTAATAATAATGATYTVTAASAPVANTSAGAVIMDTSKTLAANAVVVPSSFMTTNPIDGAFFASNVKFIYVNKVTSGSVYTLTSVKTGVQGITTATGTAGVDTGYAVYENTSAGWAVTAVYVVGDPTVANPSDVAYVSGLSGMTSVNGVNAFVYTVYFGPDAVGSITSIQPGLTGQFVTYAPTESKDLLGNTVYTLTPYSYADGRAVSAKPLENVTGANAAAKTITTASLTRLKIGNARVVDLRPGITIGKIETPDALIAATATLGLKVAVIYNDMVPTSKTDAVAYTIYVLSGASNNATLTGVTYDGTAQTITGTTLPAISFAADEDTMAVVLTPADGAAVTSIVSATPANISVSPASGNSFTITDTAGGAAAATTVTITVTAADGFTTRSYTISATGNA